MDVKFSRTPIDAYILRITLFYEVDSDEAPFGSAYCLTQCDILEGHSPEQHRSVISWKDIVLNNAAV